MESPLGSDLARLVRVWRALIDHRLKPLELTQTHWVTLHNIHQLPPEQSQIQLAKAIGIEQPSLVRTLDQLEEKGLISRQTCASDRRAKRIKLTEKAAPIITEMEAVISKTRGRSCPVFHLRSWRCLLDLSPVLSRTSTICNPATDRT